jgi:hypothetical protein
MPVPRRAPPVVLSLLLVLSASASLYTWRELQQLRRHSRDTTRALADALAALRRRDSSLAYIHARVDTVTIPVLRYVSAPAPSVTPRGADTTRRLEIQAPAIPSATASGLSPTRSCSEPRAAVDAARNADSAAAPERGHPPLSTQRWLVRRTGRVIRADAAYLGVLATADLGNAWLRIDRDPGGYSDVWNTQDKLAHAAMGALLAESAIEAGVRPPWAVALTCAGAVGFEFSQGYVSRKDIIAGCGGAAVGAGVRWGAAKLRRR